MQYNETVKLLSGYAPVEWPALYDRLTVGERMALDSALSDIATKAARLSAYLSRRATGGDHKAAVQRQNQVARKVRQALGYTYADDKITF